MIAAGELTARVKPSPKRAAANLERLMYVLLQTWRTCYLAQIICEADRISMEFLEINGAERAVCVLGVPQFSETTAVKLPPGGRCLRAGCNQDSEILRALGE